MPDEATATVPNWDERYLTGEHGMIAPSPLLLKAIEDLRPGRALDIAAGAGRHAIFLAEHGWKVDAVDGSAVGIEILRQRALDAKHTINARVTDLERGHFLIQPAAYDLICVFYYLQRNLFPSIRAGVRPGGAAVAALHLNDGKEDAKPSNPAFLLEPAELKQLFADWEITYYREGASDESGHHHDTAYLIARKPRDAR